MTSKRMVPEGLEYGVDLDSVVDFINQTNLSAYRTSWGICIEHEQYQTSIKVSAPPISSSPPIQAVVTVRSTTPKELAPFFDNFDEGSEFNGFASLGALSKSADGYHVESRLTIFEGENTWNIHLPLLVFSVLSAAESILGGIKKTLTGQSPSRNPASLWTAKDLKVVGNHLSSLSFCSYDGLRLTAEFGLEPGAISSVAGHKTALFQLAADEPNPEVGGGLFCLLSLPQRIEQKQKLIAVVAELNHLEMTSVDQPPHFGAWCVGKAGNNLAYVSFLINAMHEIPSIAINFAVWAMHRAEWANGQIQRIVAPPFKPRAPEPVRPSPVKPIPLRPTAVVPPQTNQEQNSLLIKNALGIGLSRDKLFEIEGFFKASVSRGFTKMLPSDQDLIIQKIKRNYPHLMQNEIARLIKSLERGEFFK
jgi:hypothetical protein